MYQKKNYKYLPKAKPTTRLESDIEALRVLIAGKPTRYDIQKHNEIVNAPQNIYRLRMLGWDIETGSIHFRKPSGKKSWLAGYSLSSVHRKYAIDKGIVDISIKAFSENQSIKGLGVKNEK